MAPEGSDALRQGALIDGRYALDALLGEGSFGAVWRAHDARLASRPVAVKLLKREFVEQESAVRRFDAEADALARISHPNIVGVLDRGQWEGLRYIVMEFVEGRGLSGWLTDQRAASAPPSIATVLALFDQLCAGLEAAHGVRVPGPIVHRDLKPDNILLRSTSRGELTVKVADFGIAQLGRRTGTRSGVTMGTPLYMAPEQAFGHTADIAPWTDVFALGVLLCELLTLDPQATEQDSWWVIAVRRPKELRGLLVERRTDVPEALWDLVARCLASEGPDRFADAGALRAALAAVTPGALAVAARTPPAWAPGRRLPPSPEGPTPQLADAEVAATEPSGESGPGRPPTPPTSPSAPTDGLPWVTIVTAVFGGALAVAGAIVGAVVWRDAHPAAHAVVPAVDAATPPSAPGRHAVTADAELMNLLRRWDSAMRLQPGALALGSFYAPRVRWNGQTLDDADIAAMLDRAVAAGGTNEFDWSRSTWEREPVGGPDVAATCQSFAGAAGDVVKVRAWAEEFRPDRHPSIGCPRLSGRYLLRLRRTPAGLRICHESWSLAEGICASCPTAPACRPH